MASLIDGDALALEFRRTVATSFRLGGRDWTVLPNNRGNLADFYLAIQIMNGPEYGPLMSHRHGVTQILALSVPADEEPALRKLIEMESDTTQPGAPNTPVCDPQVIRQIAEIVVEYQTGRPTISSAPSSPSPASPQTTEPAESVSPMAQAISASPSP